MPGAGPGEYDFKGNYILDSLVYKVIIYHGMKSPIMSRLTISTFQPLEPFPDEHAARVYIEKRRWPDGAVCPTCQEAGRITARKNGFYRCNACKSDFTVRTGTIFGRSHIPLHKWLFAMYLLVTTRKGISSLQLGKELGITQKSAWFLLKRIRGACGNDLTSLRGIVENDETNIGGKEKIDHSRKRPRAGRGTAGKTAATGKRERGGRAKAEPITKAVNIRLHSAIFVRYVDELTFRLNDGDGKRRTMERLANLATATFESLFTYKELAA